jgi:hypothetical protein
MRTLIVYNSVQQPRVGVWAEQTRPASASVNILSSLDLSRHKPYPSMEIIVELIWGKWVLLNCVIRWVLHLSVDAPLVW